MKEFKMDDKMTRDFFITAFRDNKLVPIIGAGFGKGMETKRLGTIPNGAMLKTYMIEQILMETPGLTKAELENEKFDMVAEIFEKKFTGEKIKQVQNYFQKNYVDVKFPNDYRKKLINDIPWEYIYTLNVDTAIEDSCREKWEVFYPKEDFDERNDYLGKSKLYKVHGDARNFIRNGDYDEMILTHSQYVRSLETNAKFHDLLQADCKGKNLIYIGCSLDNEIDIQYSVLSDNSKNMTDNEVYKIYVTNEPMTDMRKEKLSAYNITHYIELADEKEYQLLYEFMLNCYAKSTEDEESVIEHYRYKDMEVMDKDYDRNLDYITGLNIKTNILPFYYVNMESSLKISLVKDKINVFIGRRFSGKTMLGYNILERYGTMNRFLVPSFESPGTKTVQELLEQENAVIVFDSNSLDDKGVSDLFSYYIPEKDNYICLFLNSYDEVVDHIGRYEKQIHRGQEGFMLGKMASRDIKQINKKLDEIGITKFDVEKNLLDNALSIANLYNKNVVKKYEIHNKDELVIIIWCLIKGKLYYEDIVVLGLADKYKQIVKRFSPFLQEEPCTKNEIKKHSSRKVICNGKIGLLQILNAYAYLPEGAMKWAVLEERYAKICESIYYIMQRFERVDREYVKNFIMFDNLNDVFSTKYSKSAIEYLASKGKKGKNFSGGATRIIYKIYEYEDIKSLKASDPNYWLQKAKSIYLMNRKHRGSQNELYNAIKWGKKAERDSMILVESGEKKYIRTISNSIIQIAMLYGKLARIKNYNDYEVNGNAITYYYRGFSDINNMAATKTIMKNSKGTQDFNDLIQRAMTNKNIIGGGDEKELEFLINLRFNGELKYSTE